MNKYILGAILGGVALFGGGFASGYFYMKRKFFKQYEVIEDGIVPLETSEVIVGEKKSDNEEKKEEEKPELPTKLDKKDEGNDYRKTLVDYSTRANKKTDMVDDDGYNRDDYLDPYVITKYDFDNDNRHYSKITAYYYKDNVLVEEGMDNDPQYDARRYLGIDVSQIFGMVKDEDNDDENIAYVRNDRLSIDYEIIRSSQTYGDEDE